MYLLATLDAHPQFQSDLLAALDQLVAQSHTEPGTLQYDVLTDLENENRIIVFEHYADASAFQAHMESAPLQALVARFATYLSAPPSLVRMGRRNGFLREFSLG
ncbi:putative quinol monooxygenase [Pseudoduganella sp. S-14]|jgi:quinol monooxygenase YgiN|uniref:putative quinol monooxygenase n=1 Tax=Pseudoduganella sp. S-14 TaxID=3404065 RepID=UPI003CFB4DA1